MKDDSENISLGSLSSGQKRSLREGKKGIEREALRIDNSGCISKESHKKYFGSALCHEYLTTDFSEALLEIVTPPFEKIVNLISFLSDSHHFVSNSLKNEQLWPLSMPPNFTTEEEIQIAKYGKSNLAKFKTTYRKGLAKRYGRTMQAISGLHFNYSLPDAMWEWKYADDSRLNKNEVYFNAIRNVHRKSWLILYLFGASPILNKNFLNHIPNGFRSYKDSVYLPYATSLRMSHFGYQNTSQSNIEVSLNSMSEYVNDLFLLTNTKSSKYENSNLEDLSDLPQLNDNQLQIEDEYYSMIRPKSSVASDIRPISKLINHGVDYIELRSVDIDPFSPIGIEESTLYFLEAFVLYSAFSSSPKFTRDDYQVFKKNNHTVSTMGRMKDICLQKDKEQILLKDWASNILEEMDPFFDILSISQEWRREYFNSIQEPENTISGKFLRTILDSSERLDDFSLRISEKNKNDFLFLSKEDNKSWESFRNESRISLQKQKELENETQIDFNKFLEEYFDS